ncbi:hypothetical protein G7Z17_g12298 [Cylindrodendrum hubeiense]|uniref:Uncharacterized protein n=1 Tax=Cylindrodendrum hubeiense TaxID=595255 RepID=A0A9P5LAH1_9HYPO|nr:hypothetical protein G7Z17_g12298 [Cylindrodendrum hubeiense]
MVLALLAAQLLSSIPTRPRLSGASMSRPEGRARPSPGPSAPQLSGPQPLRGRARPCWGRMGAGVMAQVPKGITRGTVGQPERAPYGRRNWLPAVPVARGVLQMHDLQPGVGGSLMRERDALTTFERPLSEPRNSPAAGARIPSGRFPVAVSTTAPTSAPTGVPTGGLALPPYSVVDCGLAVVLNLRLPSLATGGSMTSNPPGHPNNGVAATQGPHQQLSCTRATWPLCPNFRRN